MMNKAQAVAYGRRIGVKYYVKNSLGGLLGGFTTLEAAEACRIRQERELRNNPWVDGSVRIYIEEV